MFIVKDPYFERMFKIVFIFVFFVLFGHFLWDRLNE